MRDTAGELRSWCRICDIGLGSWSANRKERVGFVALPTGPRIHVPTWASG